MKLNHKSYTPSDVKVISEDEGVVGAFVAVVGNKDSVGDIIQPGAFDEGLKRRMPKGVWSHDWDKPVSKTLDIFEVPAGDPRLPADLQARGLGALYVETQFNLKTQLGRDAFENVKFYGEESEWSIGYRTIKEQYDSKQKANLLHEIELYEYSPVLFGANPMTSTASIKAETIEGDMFVNIDGIDDDRAQLVKAAVMDILAKSDEDVSQLLSTEDGGEEENVDENVEKVDANTEETKEEVETDVTSDEVKQEDVSEEIVDETETDNDEESVEEEKIEDVATDVKVAGGGGSPRANRVATFEEADKKEEVEDQIELKALVGSYEERYSRIDRALSEEFAGVGYAYAYATFDDHIIYYLYEHNSGEHGYWSASYSIDSDGIVTLGEPEAVDIVEVVVLKHTLAELFKFGMGDEAEKAIVDVLNEKAGRVLSKANRSLLKSAIENITEVLGVDDDEEKTLVPVSDTESEPETKQDDIEVSEEKDEQTVEEKSDDTTEEIESEVVEEDFADPNALRKSLAEFYALIQN